MGNFCTEFVPLGSSGLLVNGRWLISKPELHQRIKTMCVNEWKLGSWENVVKFSRPKNVVRVYFTKEADANKAAALFVDNTIGAPFDGQIWRHLTNVPIDISQPQLETILQKTAPSCTVQRELPPLGGMPRWLLKLDMGEEKQLGRCPALPLGRMDESPVLHPALNCRKCCLPFSMHKDGHKCQSKCSHCGGDHSFYDKNNPCPNYKKGDKEGNRKSACCIYCVANGLNGKGHSAFSCRLLRMAEVKEVIGLRKTPLTNCDKDAKIAFTGELYKPPVVKIDLSIEKFPALMNGPNREVSSAWSPRPSQPPQQPARGSRKREVINAIVLLEDEGYIIQGPPAHSLSASSGAQSGGNPSPSPRPISAPHHPARPGNLNPAPFANIAAARSSLNSANPPAAEEQVQLKPPSKANKKRKLDIHTSANRKAIGVEIKQILQQHHIADTDMPEKIISTLEDPHTLLVMRALMERFHVVHSLETSDMEDADDSKSAANN